MSLDLEELEPGTRTDYRRANGAPMVVVDGKSERYSRPSSFADPLDDKSALVNWRIDRGCIGVALDRALQARWCAIDPDDKSMAKDKQKLRDDSISRGRGAEAADIGTALHAMSVRFEEPFFSPPEPYLSSLMEYERKLRLLGLKSTLFEFHTVNVEFRCAGTADRLYELTIPLTAPDGSLLDVGEFVIGDLKTGAKFEYSMPSYAVQEFLYAAGQLYNVVTDEFEATPPINQKWGLVVHMPADKPGECEFLWVDLEVGAFGAYIVGQVKLWRRNWRAGEFEFSLAAPLGPEPTTIGLEPIVDDAAIPPASPADDRLMHDPPPWSELHDPRSDYGPDVDEPAQIERDALYRLSVGTSEWTDNAATAVEPQVNPIEDGVVEVPATDNLAELIEWAKLRLSYISQHEAASKLLIRLWPAGLPTPKQGINTLVEMDAVMALLSQVEAEFTLTFVEGGPKTTGVRRGR